MLDKIYDKIADKTLSVWCKICRYVWIYDTFLYLVDYWSYTEYWVLSWKNGRFHKIKTTPVEFWEYIIIWHPISLARVLNALGDEYFFDNIILKKTDRDDDWQIIDTDRICERKLLTDSWNDAKLDDQSDDTIRAILWLLSE